jgi:hypothetical protein
MQELLNRIGEALAGAMVYGECWLHSTHDPELARMIRVVLKINELEPLCRTRGCLNPRHVGDKNR